MISLRANDATRLHASPALFLFVATVTMTVASAAMGGTYAGMSTEACVVNSTMPSCASFQLPAATVNADVTNLCNAMFFMTGCSLKTACAAGAGAGAGAASTGMCDTIGPLAHVCGNDGTMSMMQGCTNWNAMCKAGSTVTQCSTAKAATRALPTTLELNTRVQSICNEMSMEGCEKCTLSGKWLQCDILATYGKLCGAMPAMAQCDLWGATCAALPGDWSAIGCPGPAGSPSGPSMLMYFHGGINDYILFKGWVPKTNGEMVGACFAVFFMAMTYELLVNVRPLAESKVAARRRARAAACRSSACPPRTTTQFWSAPAGSAPAAPDVAGPPPGAVLAGVSVVSDPCPCGPGGALLPAPPAAAAAVAVGKASPAVAAAPPPVKRTAGDAAADAAMRFVFRLLTAGLGYLCMLVAMTFNGALFASVIAGYAFGGAAFGWIPSLAAEAGKGSNEIAPSEDCCS